MADSHYRARLAAACRNRGCEPTDAKVTVRPINGHCERCWAKAKVYWVNTPKGDGPLDAFCAWCWIEQYLELLRDLNTVMGVIDAGTMIPPEGSRRVNHR